MKRNNMKMIISGLVTISFVTLSACSATDVKNIVSNGNAMTIENKKLAAIPPGNVKLFYSSSDMPKHYKIIGRVSAENYNMVGMEHTQATLAEELKKQAASIGANGVININPGMAQTTADAVLIK